MPVIIPKGLAAAKTLRAEGFDVKERAGKEPEGAGDSVQIGIVNLMPTKEATEAQLMRALAATGRTIEITLIAPETHESRNTSREHIDRFYTTFREAARRHMDGLIVTGAPVEMLEFEEVDYWTELCGVMDRARSSIKSTMYICWAAQAALYRFYGIGKRELPAKCFGVFEHRFAGEEHALLRGMEEPFYAPHSRHTEVSAEEIRRAKGVRLLAVSEAAGAYLAAEEDGRSIFVTGHSEYDVDTLKKEYERDVGRGLPIEVPVGYFPQDDPEREPQAVWRGHSMQIYGSWIENIVCAGKDYGGP